MIVAIFSTLTISLVEKKVIIRLTLCGPYVHFVIKINFLILTTHFIMSLSKIVIVITFNIMFIDFSKKKKN